MVAPLLFVALSSPASAADMPQFDFDERVELVATDNDAFAMGESVRVEEPIGDNAFLAGNTVAIHAPIQGDLFATGGSLRIDAPIHGDVYAMGERVELGPDGRIDGHLWTAGATVELDGTVMGNVNVGAGELVLAGPVYGYVKADVGQLTARDDAYVTGNLKYTSPEESSDFTGRVGGSLEWTRPQADHPGHGGHTSADTPPAAAMGMWSLWTGWRIMGQLIVGAVLLLLGGHYTASFAGTLRDHPSRSLGLGLVGMVALPVLSIVACALIVPLPLGVLGLGIFGALVYLSQLVAAQAFGRVLLSRFKPELNGTPLLHLLIGVVPLAILTGLPWIGGLMGFLVTVLGAGAIALKVREATRA